MTRPNLLLITADQHRGDCFGFEGRKVKTPHLDLMARQGTRFSSCITPNVVCMPARASMLTGLLPRTHGVWDNGVDIETETAEQGFAGTLSKAGYRTAFIGKAHLSTMHTYEPTGRPECVQSMTDYGPDWTGPYMGFEHVELVVMGHNRRKPEPPPSGMHYDRFFYGDGLGDWKWDLYKAALPPVTDAVQTHHSALPPAWHNSTWVGDQAVDWIRDHKDEPFCAWVSFPDPHHPFDAPEPWSRMHHPDEVDLPEHRVRDLENRPWWHKASLEGTPQLRDQAMLQHRAKNSRVPEQSDAQLREIIANYYGMTSLIDHNVGRILIQLQKLGLDENTIVIYTSDHGDWLGDHGLILKGPMFYEGLLRVGCIVKGPGVPEDKVVEEPVSTMDLGATFLDYADAAPPRELNGRSLKPLVEKANESRDFAYNEWKLHPSRTGIDLDLRCVRTKAMKLTLELGSGAGEMYDLSEDPAETRNVFDDPAYAKRRKELEEMIASRPADEVELREPVGMA